MNDHTNTNTKRGVALDISSLCQTCKIQMQIPTCKLFFFWLKSKVYVASLSYFALLLLSCFKVHLHMHMGLWSINTIQLLHLSCCVLHPQWKRVSQLIWNSEVEAEPQFLVNWSERQKSKEKKRGTFSLNALQSVSTLTSTSASTLTTTATSTSCTLTSTSATRWPPPWNLPCSHPLWNPARPWPPGSWFKTEGGLLAFAHFMGGWGALT